MAEGQDRAASLLQDPMEVVTDVLRAGASLRRWIAGSATGAESREPAAPTAPRPAASEAPATSPLATRVLIALMDMPDAEFLAMANKVMARYHAAVAALAPPGTPPFSPFTVPCVSCGKIQTHRICQQCFDEDLPPSGQN